jgi:hypothetical protein
MEPEDAPSAVACATSADSGSAATATSSMSDGTSAQSASHAPRRLEQRGVNCGDGQGGLAHSSTAFD